MLVELDRLLIYLEERIDLDHIRSVEKLHLDAIGYRKVPYLPLSVNFPSDGDFESFTYPEAFENPEKMLLNELLWSFSSIYNSVRLKDHFPFHIRSNHGIGILSSLFGANIIIKFNNMPWVEPIGLEAAKKAVFKGVPDFNTALGKRVIDTMKHFRDRLKEYPKCFRAIRISQPDLQGPFDIAHLLLGEEVFYLAYDQPGFLHKLLELITQTYIGFRKYIDPLLTDRAGDQAVYVHGCIYGGKAVIKDDTAAIILSPRMYNEFARFYNEKIFKSFKGGSLHYCGTEKPWHFTSMDSEWLRGINYGNAELHNLKDSYAYFSQRKVPILWWGWFQKYDFLEEVYRSKIPTGMSLTAVADDSQQAREILKRHIDRQQKQLS